MQSERDAPPPPKPGHYFVEQVQARQVDLTAHLNDRWDSGYRLEHMTSISYNAVLSQSATVLVLVWAPRDDAG